nr:DCC1-like thiol-disulfide oxidoreductase family protein [Providencia rustigianii]
MNRPGLPLICNPGDRVLLFDGECNLCHGLVRFLIRADRQGKILLATVQSEEGQAILRWLALPYRSFWLHCLPGTGPALAALGGVLSGTAAAWLAISPAGVWLAFCRNGWRMRYTMRWRVTAIGCLVATTAAPCLGLSCRSAICIVVANKPAELYASLPFNRLKYQRSGPI